MLNNIIEITGLRNENLRYYDMSTNKVIDCICPYHLHPQEVRRGEIDPYLPPISARMILKDCPIHGW